MRYDVRIPGYGGAAVLLRRTIGGNPPTQAAVDASLVAPQFVNTVRDRVVGVDFLPDLARWLFAAANEAAPERALAPFEDESVGITLNVESSDDERIELLASVTDEVGGSEEDAYQMTFDSSRAALVHSAQCVSELCGGVVLADFERLGE